MKAESKTAVFVTHRIYNEHSRIELYNNVHNKLKAIGVQWEIISLREPKKFWNKRNEEFNVPITDLSSISGSIVRCYTLIVHLLNKKPKHITLGGYGSSEYWAALIYSRLSRIPITLYTGGGQQSAVNRYPFVNIFKTLFVRLCNSYITYGSRAADFLVRMGVDSSKINIGYNVSDVEYFSHASQIYRKSRDFKEKKIEHSRPILVFSGRVIELKGIHLLIKQLKKRLANSYHLYIAGEGKLASVVENEIENQNINATYIGLVDRKRLAEILTLADVYISPSLRDPFSRTLSEALACNCFCLASIYDDATYDFIDSSNGIRFDPASDNSFNNALEEVFSKNWEDIDSSQFKLPEHITYENYANQIYKSIQQSLDERNS